MHSRQDFKIVSIAIIALIAATFAHVQVRFPPAKRYTIEEDAPFFVQLRDQFGLFLCSGSLVTPSHVVTSAQCLTQRTTEDTFVFVGRSRFDKELNYEIENWSIPSEFNETSLDKDVAVVKLRHQIKIDSTIHPLRLCSESLKTGNSVSVVGFGTDIEEDNFRTDYLRVGSYPVISREQCSQSYKDVDTKLTDSMICIADDDNFIGNLGGSAVRKGKLCGISSWGIENAPGVFTDIIAVKSFIENAIKS